MLIDMFIYITTPTKPIRLTNDGSIVYIIPFPSLQVEDRFKNNTDHTEALRECALARDPICLGVHLHQCNLHTLPQMGERLDSTSHKLLQLSVSLLFQ